MSIWNKISKPFEKIICYTVVFILTPCYFIFEMLVVRPVVIEEYNLNYVEQIIHLVCPSFCFVNIVGNMILSIYTDTSLKRSVGEVHYCDICDMSRPNNAWHCKKCGICVLKRDHHCIFFSRCIGLYNRRYYVTYLFYIFVSMVYSSYYNCLYVHTKVNILDLILKMFASFNPFMRWIVLIENICTCFLVMNGGLVLWSGLLFAVHMRNVLRGVTARQGKNSEPVEWNIMKRNFVDTFGSNWVWAILWPLADSPLPNKCD